MSLTRTLVLGFIAGATIVLGLPIGRMRNPAPRLRTLLNALAVGVLFFLVIDVFSHAYAPIDDQLVALHHHHHGGSVARAVADIALLVGGAALGLLSLAFYQRWTRRRREARHEGPPEEFAHSPAHLSMMIAIGIGLHNFGEGLAIGASARLGALALSTVLVIGFGLHNATEGFGIVSPMAGSSHRPSWGFLGLVALIGGGPTTLGTLVGWLWSSTTLSVLFLSLAGGSIIFVICQLLYVASRSANPTTVYLGVAAGLIVGFLTDIVVTSAGG
ncbi:MAG: zinc permease [Acidobacteriota bacterium]|nr:zinc permease [Acidobacteriota bacterium]